MHWRCTSSTAESWTDTYEHGEQMDLQTEDGYAWAREPQQAVHLHVGIEDVFVSELNTQACFYCWDWDAVD